MNILYFIYNELIYRPLFNTLVFLYNIIPGHDIGLAIILLTIIVRLLLYKFNGKSIKNQKKLQEIQPKIREIQKKYKNDREKQAQELMAVYQANKINPLSGCLPLLIQFPIIIALYKVFLSGFQDEKLNLLYSFVENPGHINAISFGVDLSVPNFYLALLAAVFQYYQTKTMMGNSLKSEGKTESSKDSEKSPEEKMQDFTQSLMKNMMLVLPVVTFIFGMKFPSGLSLYWSVSTLFAIVQQYLIMKNKKSEVVADEK